MSTFGARLIEAREARGIKIGDFAKRINVKYGTYYNWEHDIAKPMHDSSIRLMADELGVTYNWLMAGVGERDKAKHAELLKSQELKKSISHQQTTGQKTISTDGSVKRFYPKDARQLEDIELTIKHIKDMALSDDEKKAIFLTLSEIRTDLEVRVMFGVSA